MFRQVYPFSPALVQTLVAVSSVLQRERTALKVMLQLLVDQRDTLKVGDVMPVGDLFDVIAQGDEPFTEGMRIHFDHAKQLYHRKLLPMLERTHTSRARSFGRCRKTSPRQARFAAQRRSPDQDAVAGGPRARSRGAEGADAGRASRRSTTGASAPPSPDARAGGAQPLRSGRRRSARSRSPTTRIRPSRYS